MNMTLNFEKKTWPLSVALQGHPVWLMYTVNFILCSLNKLVFIISFPDFIKKDILD